MRCYNFLDWERNQRIILWTNGRWDALEIPILIITSTSTNEEKVAHKTVKEMTVIVTFLMPVTHKAILECKLEEVKSVATHVFEMIWYLEVIERLGFPYSQEFDTDIILHSLYKGFNQFMLNFNMNRVSKNLAELHGMLINVE